MGDWLARRTNNQRNWRFGLRFLYLRNLKSFKWNHKCNRTVAFHCGIAGVLLLVNLYITMNVISTSPPTIYTDFTNFF